MDLIEEYEARLRHGEDPKISDYVARYRGHDKESFEIDLRLVAIMVQDARRNDRRLEEAIRHVDLEKQKESVRRRLHGGT